MMLHWMLLVMHSALVLKVLVLQNYKPLQLEI
jgi:hypothetical protein